MAKKEKKVVDTTKREEPMVDNTVDKIKIKKPKKFAQTDNTVKLDLSKKEEPAKTEEKPTEEKVEETPVVEVVEKVEEKVEEKETPTVEEITEEKEKEVEELKEEVEEAVAEARETGKPVPENIQKLMDFMDETGGDLNDYVELNRDISKLDNQDVLLEYYRKTKPHLSLEEINFLMEDNFSYDEETMDEKQIRRKKLALKEQVANARQHLDGLKSKYYEEIKAGSKQLTPDQQKAQDFFSRYNKEQEQVKKNQQVFRNKTDKVFNENFKGFEYNVGDKKFRLNIKDAAQVKEKQSDVENLFKRFLNENNVINDAQGYHKSIYTAMNPDTIAQHFYEQGKADATKERVARDKNISLNPRTTQNEVNVNGVKYKVLGDDSSSLKVKMRKRN
tara:strand:- start:1363 stop:2532 length:1170 start_codon:yes stop_codon:yes gene_type:complete